MSASDIHLVRELVVHQAALRKLPLDARRAQYELAEGTFNCGATAPGEIVNAGGCRAEWVKARTRPKEPVVLYLHGGGYSLGSPRSHRHLAAAIGRAGGASVLSAGYRLAPEHRFPAALEDSVAAASWLLDRVDGAVVLAGDSAGGGLVVAVMMALRDRGGPMPTAGVCISPWVDLTCESAAYERLARRDPLLSGGDLREMADRYLGDGDPSHPLASPALGTFEGLPRLLIHVGSDEILLDDSRRLAKVAQAAGVQVELREWPGMIHAWHWYFPVLEEGRLAIEQIGAFIRAGTGVTNTGVVAPGELDSSRVREETPMVPDESSPVPASLVQEAHLLLTDTTTSRGFLSWAYQLNGRLDVRALEHALDEVVSGHNILRARFVTRAGRTCHVVSPFVPGTLVVRDLGALDKRAALDAAVAELRDLYESLSPLEDPRFRAILYTIDAKTSVLAMFVAEALVDGDGGSILTSEISKRYAMHSGDACSTFAAALPDGGISFLDHLREERPSAAALVRARRHWASQAQAAPELSGWPTTPAREMSRCAFSLEQPEWRELLSCTRDLRITPYVLVLTALQVALAETLEIRRFLAHAIVSLRSDATANVIGNFQSVARLDLRLEEDGDFTSATVRTAASIAEAVEHCVLPAPLAGPQKLMALPSGEALPPIRFYMFCSHPGPTFAGLRRRRFRLHGTARAPLTVSAIETHRSRHDFVLSSTTAPQDRLDRLAQALGDLLDPRTIRA